MGCKGDLASQLQDGSGHNVGVAGAEHEEGSEEEEEEPFERVFYDDDDANGDELETQPVDPCDDYPLPEEEEEEASGEEPCNDVAPPDGDNASDEEPFYSEEEEDSGEEDLFHAEPLTDPVRNSRSTCRKQLHEVEPNYDQLENEQEPFSKRFSDVQAVRKEQNKQEAVKQVLKKGGSNEEKVVPVTDEMEVKPFKKRLSVRFATDVSCYTYNTESFGAAKLEKRKAQFDDMDSQLCKRQEHMLSLPQDGDKLKEVDDTNLYVGNLPATMSSHKLLELFFPFGRVVRYKVVDDCFTGISQGYGFVKYAEPDSAASAIRRMNGRLVDGKTLEVRAAGVPPSIPNPSMHSKEIDTSDLYICNLPLSMNELKLLEHFLPFGKVTGIKVPRDHATGLSKGYGFVKYSDSHQAAKAITHLNGVLVEGRKMEVQVAISPSTLSSSVVGSLTNTRTIKEIDMDNLYVCNIHASIDTNKLVELFSPFGKITHARVAADQGIFSGKRYGFVRFADPQCAAQAIAAMNGALIEGEALTVRVAGLSSSESSSAVVQGSPPEINKSRLYVTNLPRSMNADKLVSLFVPFGQISKVVINVEYSLVYYTDVASAITAAKNMDGYLIDGKSLAVRISDSFCPAPTNAAAAADHALSDSAGKPMKEIDMANLFVGSIPPTLTADQLLELFRPFGQVVQARMFQHKGYGIIRYDNSSSAAAAIDHIDGYQIGGSALVVRVAGLPNPKDSSAATNSLAPLQMPGYEQKQVDMTNLYVCHLPLYITTEKLIEIFLPCGQISQAKVVVDRYTGVSKGFGFVRFADTYGAAVALTHMNGYPLEGHILEVRIAGVHASAMTSYMTYLYSQLTYPDTSTTAVGVPTSYWPYYCAESAYATTSAENQGPATDASSQASQQEGLPESMSVSSVTEKDCSSVSSHATDPSQPRSSAGWAGPPGFEPHSQPESSVRWAGPPGFEPHAAPKKDLGTVMNPSQPCSKVQLAQSEGGQKRRPVV
ncbi:hypothetical protein QYE76_047684 [Lolium multiflorum]|uniref:RRM domain-containing protein n=1 Tax=Lolium multiflorum TaxID=4521 RepID=A0AAD8X1T6_LOLMU|nr:hypothetical protein QYE76_047684 [Lolium multiflorum]